MHSTPIRKLAAGVTIAGLLLSAVPSFAAGGPSVTLSSTEASPTANTNIPITATLSTSTTNFTASSISVTNGTVGNFSGSGTTYTFTVTPTVAPGDPDGSHYVISVTVGDNAFDGNNPSNTLVFGYDPTMASTSGSGGTGTTTDTTAPTITFIDPSPQDGSTVSTSSVVFAFTTDDASSSVMCSIVGTSSPDSFYACGSPQIFTLPSGAYRFAAAATDTSNNTASSSRMFTVAVSTSTATTSDSGSSGSSGSGGGGGGGGAPASSPAPVRESGIGSAIGGPPAGHTVIPTFGNSVAGNSVAIVPTVPTSQQSSPIAVTTPTPDTGSTGAVSTESAGPTVSQSSGGSALVPTASPNTATPGTPNTGSANSPQAGGTDANNTAPEDTATSAPVDQTPLIPNTGDLSAASANAGAAVPGWVWLVLAAIVLIGIGVWALRQPA